MNKIRIVVIDTGVDSNFAIKNKFVKNGFHVIFRNEKLDIEESANDEIGHGTAISNIIGNALKESEIIPIKIFDKEYFTDEGKLVFALEYVRDNVPCDIINLSLGLNACENEKRLRKVISDLYKKGIIIVSAFNNDGSISYPALYENVIGVDTSFSCNKINEFEFVENSIVNIKAKGGTQRVKWLNDEYRIVQGNSFAAAYVSAEIGILLQGGIDAKRINTGLREKAKKVITYDNTKKNNHSLFKIKRAIIFPYNKEEQSLLKFNNLLDFEIVNVCDIRESGNVGRDISPYNLKINRIINIDKIDWNDDFDTVILGHLNKLSEILNCDFKNEIYNLCRKYSKQIFSMDYVEESVRKTFGKIYCPYIDSNDLPQNQFGKLYNISKPVLGVFGTGSAQGKFTLQLILRNKFIDNGYKIGQIGTEPTAKLFGMDYVYPMGYGNSVNIKGFDCVSLLNGYVNELCKRNEIVLVGSQANTVPLLYGNQGYFPTKQIEFLLGTHPDACILCVNAHDDYEYISRTINMMESLVETKVIATVLFPKKLRDGWMGLNGGTFAITKEDITGLSNYINEKHGIKTFLLGNETEMTELWNTCINYFSEEE